MVLAEKNLPANAGNKILGFNPWVGKIPWRMKGQPTPVFLPGESHGQRGLEAYSAQGRRVRHELATKQQHRVHTLFSEHLSEKMVSDASS